MKKLMSVVMVFLAMAAGMKAYAANYDNPVEGKLKAVYSNFIILRIPSTVSKSPEINASSKGDLQFQINSKTAYDNFNQITDLKQGDILKVAYSEPTDKSTSENAKVADRITRTHLASEGYALPGLDVAGSNNYGSSSTTTQTVTTTTVTNRDGNTETNP